MTGKERRQFEMLVRVRTFGQTNAALFAALPVAQQTFAAVATAVDDLTTADMKKMSATTASRADRRALARGTLIDLLQRCALLARNLRAEGREVAGFALPASRSDVSLITAGRQFSLDAAPLEAEFTGHGMSPAHILAVTTAFEGTVTDQGHSRTERVAARTRIRNLITAAIRGVRRLDLIIANELGGDEVVQAQWAQLRRLDGTRSARNGAETDLPAPAEPQAPDTAHAGA